MSSFVFAAPALPLHTAGKYVAGAYIVFVILLLVYLGIMATRLSRTERDLVELRRDVEASAAAAERDFESQPAAAARAIRRDDQPDAPAGPRPAHPHPDAAKSREIAQLG